MDEYLPLEIRHYAKNHKRNLALVYVRSNNDLLDEIFVPACLPKSYELKPGTYCYISGVGNSTDSMKTVALKIRSKDDCRDLTSNNDYEKHENLDIVQWDICASNPNTSDCNQFLDTGSPLICEEGGKAVVYGVASLALAGNEFRKVNYILVSKQTYK